MTSIKKFKFDTSFDPGSGGTDSRGERKYTTDDLAIAEEAAREQGRLAGIAEARTSIEHTTAVALSRIGGQLQALGRTTEDIHYESASHALKIAVAAVRKVLPDLARRNGLAEIEALVRECLNTFYDEPRVVVRLHDKMLDPLRERIDDIAAGCGFNGKIVLFGDEHLAETDCRVEWADGGAERNLTGLYQEIGQVVEKVTGPLPAMPDLAPEPKYGEGPETDHSQAPESEIDASIDVSQGDQVPEKAHSTTGV
jgi:flagellar assembly protein FliH